MRNQETFSNFVMERDQNDEVTQRKFLLTVSDYKQNRNNDSQDKLFQEIASFADIITHTQDRVLLTASTDFLLIQKLSPETASEGDDY